jgi:uncharacterized protein YecT (DUF1311 family)
MRTILLLVPLLFLPASLHGAAQSQQEMNAQARKDFEKADAELNEVYRSVIAGLPDEIAVDLLRKAQRAWVAFRDADALSHSDEMRDGSAAPLLLYGQKTRLTKDRVKYLRERLDMKEP